MKRILFCLAIAVSANMQAQDSLVLKKRKQYCYAGGLGGTALVHAGLYQLWYKDYPSAPFHFFNDNREWLQMDKAGHAFSSYYLGLAGIEAARWSGVPQKHVWKWALFGSIFQTPIEIWDGFSAGWGASAGDLAANTFGTLLCAGQEALWHKQKLILKYAYGGSTYASIRPGTLGSTLNERLLKDYNAQTYWLCFRPVKSDAIKWLGLAAGYGANGMLGGHDNIWTNQNGQVFDYSQTTRFRQYYLGFDYNLTRINTSSKALKRLLFVLNCIKLPSPALEFSQNRIKGHWLLF